MIAIEEVFKITNNLDWREALRKFGPKYSIAIINPDFKIEYVERFKKLPKMSTQNSILGKYNGCCGMMISPGMYKTVTELRDRINSCQSAFDVIAHEREMKNQGGKGIRISSESLRAQCIGHGGSS